MLVEEMGEKVVDRKRNKLGYFVKDRERVKLICKTCGKEFLVIPYYANSKKKYCSWDCKKKGLIGNKINFKNGRTLWHGYVFIYQPNHPYPNKNNYIFEHRFVMEQHLGRYLKDGEVVHHINNVKGDNRLENLMLFPNNVAHIQFHKFSQDKKGRYFKK